MLVFGGISLPSRCISNLPSCLVPPLAYSWNSPICICGLACANPSPPPAFETVVGTRKRAAGSVTEESRGKSLSICFGYGIFVVKLTGYRIYRCELVSCHCSGFELKGNTYVTPTFFV